MLNFHNKTAIVTGSAQGVGRAVAVLLARQGARIVLADRKAEYLDRVKAQIERDGGEVLVVEGDLETFAAAQALVAAARDRFGRIDCAIHNVGGAIRAKPFWEFDPGEIEAEISRSLWPTIWGCRSVIPAMLEQGAGTIVNIGSAATRWMWRVPYSTAKGGIHALTECLGRELAQTGVRINGVAPGALDVADRIVPRNPSPPGASDARWREAAIAQSLADTPMARPGTVGEIAAAVAYLASDESAYITGQTLSVAGGASI